MNVTHFKALIFVVPLVLAPLTPASAVDVVTRRSDNAGIRGTITKSDNAQVTVKRSNGEENSVASSDVKSVVFDGEPSTLRTARSNANSGAFDTALEKLKEIQSSYSGSNKLLKADIAFMIARAQGKQAQTDPSKVDAALAALKAFRDGNKTSFRYLEATLLEASLHGIKKDAAAGKVLLTEVQQSSVKGYQLQAGVDLGRLLLSSGDAAGAQASFQDVVGKSKGDPETSAAMYDGMLGLAMCLKQQNSVDEAIKTLNDIIAKAPDSETRTLAEAWLRKGDCLKQKNMAKDALMAYLSVDVLYSSEPAQHAEALKRLSELWTPAGHEDRAIDATTRLTERYPNSQWVRPSASGG